MTTITRAAVEEFDHRDPLSGLREEFDLPSDIYYLDGNSLGAMPRAAKRRAIEVLTDEWSSTLIDSWVEHDWLSVAKRVGDKIGVLIGAKPGEVVVADSTSVNIFKTLTAALQANSERRTILSEAGNFPTDLYVMQGLRAFAPDRVALVVADADDVVDRLTDEVAVLLLTQVHYKSGLIRNMKEITRRAHDAGALVIWDLCHSTGSIPVDLNDCGVDFAVGCGYKFLNGGPGAPAYLYAAERYHHTGIPALTGWFGHEAPFEFSDDYRPAPDIRRFQCGTPPVLAASILECGVDLFAKTSMTELRRKAVALSSLFIELMDIHCAQFGFELLSPREDALRAGNVSFTHPACYAITQAVKKRGVIGDFRAPDVMRFGIAPMYLRYRDIFDVVEIIEEVMLCGQWDRAEYEAVPAWS